jgi:hypothetical protein
MVSSHFMILMGKFMIHHDTPWNFDGFPRIFQAEPWLYPPGTHPVFKRDNWKILHLYIDVFFIFFSIYHPVPPPFMRNCPWPHLIPRGSHRAGVSERSAATTTRRRGTGLPRRSRVALASWSRNVGVENPMVCSSVYHGISTIMFVGL